jgi:virginiamycin B lyase
VKPLAAKSGRIQQVISEADMKRRTKKRMWRGLEILEARTLLSGTGGSIIQPTPLPPVPAPVPAGPVYSASSLVQGPDGNIWFTDQNNNAIGRETPDGTIAEFPLPTTDAGPDQIVSASDGNLWFIETGADQIARITPAGNVTEFPLPQDASPGALAAGTGGNLWFIDDSNNDIGRITTAGKVTEFPVDSNSFTLSDALVQGPDGNIWAAAEDDSWNSVLLKMTPAGKITSVSLNAYPSDLTVGPDNNLYVACDSEIERVSTAGVVTSLPLPNGDGASDIITGPDGALWFTTYGSNSMGRITTTGSAFEFDPTGLSQYGYVNDLASGLGNKIWFASDSLTNTAPVSSFDPQNALLAGGVDGTATAGATSSLTLASFVDLSGNTAASDYHATIDWGDGTTSAGTITPNSQGGFDVSASHAWAIGGTDVTVTITDVRPASADPGGLAGRTATATTSITSPAPPTQGTGVDVSAISGQLFTGVVAHYTGVLLNSLSSYSANIDWGDGHFTSGVIAPDGQGGVSITGSHRYGAQGSYMISTNLWPWSFGPIVPIAYSGAGGATVKVVARGTSIGLAGKVLATATGGNSGTVVSPPVIIGGGGGISLRRIWGGDGTTSTATVSAGAMDGTGYTLLASGTQPFDNTVASFKLADPNEDLSHLQATVKWNDGDTFDWYTASLPDITDAPITSDGQGGFTVSAKANFPDFGWFHYQVLISDDRLGTGDSAIVGVAYGQVIVDTPIRPVPFPIEGGIVANAGGGVASSAGVAAPSSAVLSEHVKFSSVTIRHVAGSAFEGKLGVLTGLAKGTTVSDLQGTINWGDGSSSDAQFTLGKKGRVIVKGTHTYLGDGTKSVSISVTQSLDSSGSPAGNPPVQLPHGQSSAHITRAHRRGQARRR